jgi:hypothetical protein
VTRGRVEKIRILVLALMMSPYLPRPIRPREGGDKRSLLKRTKRERRLLNAEEGHGRTLKRRAMPKAGVMLKKRRYGSPGDEMLDVASNRILRLQVKTDQPRK